MPTLMTAQGIAREFPELEGFIKGYVDWAPCVRYDTLLINAAGVAIANGQPMFNVAARINLPGVCNLERVAEVPYPTIFLGFAWQLVYDPAANVAPNIADAIIAKHELEFVFIKDGKDYPSWPAPALPGGGGLNRVEATVAAGAATSNVSNGLTNRWRLLYQPIAVDIKQTFSLLIRSMVVAAPVVALNLRFMLMGIEARRPN